MAVLFPIVDQILQGGAKTDSHSAVIRGINMLIAVVPIKDMFIATSVFIIAVVILKNVFRYSYLVFNSFASYKIWDDMQKQLFRKYITADYKYFLDHKQGEIVYRLYSAPAVLGGALQMIPQLATEILKISFICIVLFSMSFPVACGILVIAVVFYILTRGISKKISYFLGKGRLEACEHQNIVISEMIHGIKQIKVFLGERKWVSNFFRATDKYFGLSRKDTLWINMPVSILEIFAISTVCLSLIAVRKLSPGDLVSSLPLLAVFAYAFQRVIPSLSVITSLRMQIMGSLPIMETLRSLFDEQMSVLKDGSITLDSFNEKIEFRNISFAYPGRSRVLRDLSLEFPKNSCVALIGSSGSGKTTMVNLLIRLFEPTKGEILVDGRDLRTYTRSSWLKKIGFVSQDTFIFHASVRDNITFGFDQASMDDVVGAAAISNAHDFIMKLPNGYNTIVGEKGMKLSGGEQQRIAIARAVLRKPQILIFDEATSALDNASQSLIQNAINKIVKDHTVILIAHRLSTIVNADKIIVLDNGAIEETGVHAELIARKGSYWKLYNNE
ncbi:ABC transporter ATP-binding protein [Candidatus Omnitrophota bacterium]